MCFARTSAAQYSRPSFSSQRRWKNVFSGFFAGWPGTTGTGSGGMNDRGLGYLLRSTTGADNESGNGAAEDVEGIVLKTVEGAAGGGGGGIILDDAAQGGGFDGPAPVLDPVTGGST